MYGICKICKRCGWVSMWEMSMYCLRQPHYGLLFVDVWGPPLRLCVRAPTSFQLRHCSAWACPVPHCVLWGPNQPLTYLKAILQECEVDRVVELHNEAACVRGGRGGRDVCAVCICVPCACLAHASHQQMLAHTLTHTAQGALAHLAGYPRACQG